MWWYIADTIIPFFDDNNQYSLIPWPGTIIETFLEHIHYPLDLPWPVFISQSTLYLVDFGMHIVNLGASWTKNIPMKTS